MHILKEKPLEQLKVRALLKGLMVNSARQAQDSQVRCPSPLSPTPSLCYNIVSTSKEKYTAISVILPLQHKE